MYQAITTRYLGPSNVKGARIKAFAEAGAITFSWNHALNAEENHCKAAHALADKYGWKGNYFGAPLPHGSSDYVWVCGDLAREGRDMFKIEKSSRAV